MTKPTTNEQPHVAVLAFPFSTHAAPLLSVTHHLANLSPAIHFSFFSTPSSNLSIFSSYPNLPPNVKPYDVWDGAPNGCVNTGKTQEEMGLFISVAPESFRKGMEKAVEESGRRVTCLITDAFFWFGREMAEEIGGGVKWLPFWTAGPHSLSTHIYTDFIRESFAGDVTGREDELLKPFPGGMSKVRVRDLPEGVAFGRVDSPFCQMLHKMGQTLPRADAVLINSFEELDPTLTNDLKSKLKSYLNIGPFNLISPPPHVPDTYDCIPWLDKQQLASVAYVSFGSVTIPPPHELVALAEALEARKVPFIWSLRDSAKVHLPSGFLERTKFRGIVIPWAPQAKILEHEAVGVFITHCGWNSLLETIVGGVPVICRPFFGDQRLNGRMIENVWEIGIIDNEVLAKDVVINSLDKILSQEDGKQMRGRLKSLKNLALAATGYKGSSSDNIGELSRLVSSTGH